LFVILYLFWFLICAAGVSEKLFSAEKATLARLAKAPFLHYSQEKFFSPSRYAARVFEFCEAVFQNMSFFFTGVYPSLLQSEILGKNG
jgi:hypothetical protein